MSFWPCSVARWIFVVSPPRDRPKREEKPLSTAPEPEQPAQVLDLMTALNESVQKAKASRTGSAGPAQVHELPKPKKKTAAKKQPAKKAAKKTTGRRPRSA
ncbi:hypothetical protein ACH47Z_47015 [Streptomyces sp. NPDC020192]|uniref:hypothetical protein n=1 Tax=Streptomyces sp. NPDC020192 TaxID=3365066 RepID=UPI0037B4D0AF